MELINLPGGEGHPVYQRVHEENIERHYDFLISMIRASLDSEQAFLSHSLIKALNFHAIACLHHEAGQYRSQEVTVLEKDTVSYKPPKSCKVAPLMNDLVYSINENWNIQDSVELAAKALWRINHIHPFINGNGRTARAVCYFILCVKIGGPLPGRTILPELLRAQNIHPKYVCALKQADKGDLRPLTELVTQAITWQIQST